MHDIHQPVDYNPGTHRYSFKQRAYISATQLLDKFKYHFNVEERSVYMADKYGSTPEYWRSKWRSITDESLERGNEIHDSQEQQTYKAKFINFNTSILPVHNPEEIPYTQLLDGIYPEMKLWRHDYECAGRSDKVILYTDPSSPCKRFADIEDYKTNRKIRRFSFQYPDGTYQMMKGPVAHLMDCEFNHYALQLSAYQFMLEYFGFDPGRRRIIHFPHPIEGLGTPQPVVYELPYLRKEVIVMLQTSQTLQSRKSAFKQMPV